MLVQKCLTLLTLCTVTITEVAAQTSVVNKGATQLDAVPVQVRYLAFFGNVSRLEQSAVEAERRGKSGSDIRNYYKRGLSLTDSEHAPLCQHD